MEGRRSSRSQIYKHSLEQGTDRLSELRDSVLLHILSFMDMKYVVPTSILSKRWRNLWKSVPNMDFGQLWPGSVHRSLNFIERSLTLREDSKISKFRICIENATYPAERVDSWISFAVRHNVEQLHLNFFSTDCYGIESNTDCYGTPHCIYHCASLVSLTLRHCKIDLPTSTCLSSLKTLFLHRIDLADDVTRALISGCPLLEDLTLYECNQCSDLNIFAENSRLKNLNMIEWDCLLNKEGTNYSIFAPNLLSLDFAGHMPRESYDVKDLSSLVTASFSFEELWNEDCSCTDNFLNLLDQICHIKELKLCTRCIVELSHREIRGASTPVLFGVSTLVLRTGFCIYELPGIVYMLRSFVNIEVLIIDVWEEDESSKFEEDFQDDCEFDELKYWKPLKTFFVDKLHGLKTIEIHGLIMERECTTQKIEAAAAAITKDEMVEYVLEEDGIIVDFIAVLVDNSAVLEKYTITTEDQICYANLFFTC